MPLADIGNFKLHYALDGGSSRPVVALSNSLGADISMWDAQMDALLTHFSVLRYDTRGHGRSESPGGPSTLADLGRDLLSLLDRLSISKAQLCGVSLGGITSMWCGLHAPHRVSSLVLSNTSAKIGSGGMWKQRMEQVETHGVSSIADAVVPRWFTKRFQESGHALDAQKAMLLGCSSEGYLAACAALRDSDLREEIYAITAPTLVISGESDMVTPPVDGQALTAAIPSAVFVEVPGAHLSNIEEPEAYNRVLLAFLQRHAVYEVTR